MSNQTLTVLNQKQLIEKQVKLYRDLLDQNLENWYNKQGYQRKSNENHIIETGRKYFKVLRGENGSRSVHAFIDKTNGNVFMAATYKKPAKGVRYNLINQISLRALIPNLDPFGGYLYMDKAIANHQKEGVKIQEVVA